MTVEELRAHYPELARLELVDVDVVDDGERLTTFADGSLDFIVANHFLEHTGDPISTIETHLRKLAPGGALFYAVPDKRYTFDVSRPVTPLEHMLRDREEGPQVSRAQHFEEWARHVYHGPADPPRSEERIAELARELEQRDYSIHTHVWTQSEFLQLLLRCRELLATPFDLEAVWKAGMELIVVLRETSAPPRAPQAIVAGVAAARAGGDVGAYIVELELALAQRDEELAETRGALARERARSRSLEDAPGRLAERPLRIAEKARRRLRASRRRDLVSLPLSAFTADLDDGWPRGARWHGAAELPERAAPALEQPVGSRIAIPLTVPPGARLRTAGALPLMAWNDASGGLAFEIGVHDRDGRRLGSWSAATDAASAGAHWREVVLDAPIGEVGSGELLLTFELRQVSDATEGLGVAAGLWVDPQLELPVGAVPEVTPAATGRVALAAADPRPQGVPAFSPPLALADEPLISLLTPVHDPQPAFLEQLLNQVRRQTFEGWQLCLVDDGSSDPRVRELLERHAAEEPRIAFARHEQAGGIVAATNKALELARGTYVTFVDHDDAISGDALATIAAAIEADPAVDVLYSDEDHILETGRRYAPYLKPDWSPDLFRSLMFTGHLGVIRRALVEQLGGLRAEFEGSQDYDLMLRAVERSDRVAHLPALLYHWRVHEQSSAAGAEAKPYAYEAARRALNEHLARLGVGAHAEPADAPGRYRIVHELPAGTSIALLLALTGSLVAPGWEQRLAHCAASWDGPHAQPALVVAGTAERVAAAERALAEAGVAPGRARTVVSEDSDRARLLAQAADAAEGLDLLLWTDVLAAVEPDAGDWLTRLAGHALQPGVGAVGAKLLAPDGRVEQAGVVVPGGLALPAHHGAAGDADGHLANLRVAANWSAVAGVVMTTRARFERERGLDPDLGPLAEVDLCLRMRARGERIVLVPDALLRRLGPTPARNDAIALERLRRRWAAALPRDPYYNRAFWQGRGDFTS